MVVRYVHAVCLVVDMKRSEKMKYTSAQRRTLEFPNKHHEGTATTVNVLKSKTKPGKAGDKKMKEKLCLLTSSNCKTQ